MIVQISRDVTTNCSFYSQDTAFPNFQDCSFEQMERDIPYASTLVDMSGYNGFPLSTTCHIPTSNSHSPCSNCQANGHVLIYRETCHNDFNFRMAPADSADHGRPRLQDDTINPWDQSISFNMPLDNEICFLPPASSLLPQQFTSSTSLLSPTCPTAWQFANFVPVQQPSTQGSALSCKRKRYISNDVNEDLMLRDREQRVSKRARIPPSSVNIVSFKGGKKFRVTRERRTDSEKENIQELALLGGSCTRCEHAKKRVRFLTSHNVMHMADKS